MNDNLPPYRRSYTCHECGGDVGTIMFNGKRVVVPHDGEDSNDCDASYKEPKPVSCSYAGRADCSVGGIKWRVAYRRTVAPIGRRTIIDVVCDAHLAFACDRADDVVKIQVTREVVESSETKGCANY